MTERSFNMTKITRILLLMPAAIMFVIFILAFTCMPLPTLNLSYINETFYPELIGVISGLLAARGISGRWY
jgi:hypothetical protein